MRTVDPKRLQERLDMLEAEIADLEAQAFDVGGDEALIVQGQIDLLRHQQASLQRQLQDARGGGLFGAVTSFFRR